MRTPLCVRIGVYYDGGRLCYRAWLEIRGKTPQNELTFLRVHNTCVVSIFLEVCRDCSRIVNANGIIEVEIKYTRDVLW